MYFLSSTAMLLPVLMHFYPRNSINLWLLQNSLSIQTLSAASCSDGSRGGSALSLLSTSFPLLTSVHLPPLLPPTTWYDWTTDNIVLGSNLRYTTEVVHVIRRSELTLASDVMRVGVLLKMLGNSLPSRIQRGSRHLSLPTSFAQHPLHTSPSVP